jgi:SAM-dependent methyltransferase
MSERILGPATPTGLTSPPSQADFRRHGSSLAMYRRIPDLQNFWEEHWGHRPIADVLADARSGRLGELEYSLLTFLPPGGVILEAGCGTGRIVQALTSRGFDVVGVDYAADTVSQVVQSAPELRVEVGDLTDLRWGDSSISAYVSIGVMEHVFDGPDRLILEALRVLEPGGRALISVPYKNRLRARRWRRVPHAEGEILSGEWRFYQDHVDVAAFAGLLDRLGFTVIDQHPYGMYGALLRDSEILAALNARGLLRHRVRSALKWCCARAPMSVRRNYSHMMMFVCEKPLDS